MSFWYKLKKCRCIYDWGLKKFNYDKDGKFNGAPAPGLTLLNFVF